MQKIFLTTAVRSVGGQLPPNPFFLSSGLLASLSLHFCFNVLQHDILKIPRRPQEFLAPSSSYAIKDDSTDGMKGM